MEKGRINILLVDDHQVVLEGIKTIVKSIDTTLVLWEANNGREALQVIEKQKIDIVITDIKMPEMSGIELAQVIKNKYPEIKILFLSMHKDREFVKAAVKVDADGYLLKISNRDQFSKAIHQIINNNTYYDQDIIPLLKEERKQKVQLIDDLSTREIEVIKLICQEYSSDEIAFKLFVSRHTVDAYRKNILRKIDAKNVVGIMRFAIHHNLISDM